MPDVVFLYSVQVYFTMLFISLADFFSASIANLSLSKQHQSREATVIIIYLCE